MASDIGGHDDDGIFKIYEASFGVCDMAVVHDLEEGVKDIWVGFFYFIEEDDGVGFSADSFGELAAFVVADVPWGSAEHASDGMFFHIFGHIEADDIGFGVEEGFSEGFGEFGFSDACGAEEEEGADGAFKVFDACAGTDDGFGDEGNGFVLADNAFMEDVF